MSEPTAGRAGVAIVRVELDAATPGRMLIAVRTVDDLSGQAAPEAHAFVDARAALAHLAQWLERWGT